MLVILSYFKIFFGSIDFLNQKSLNIKNIKEYVLKIRQKYRQTW